jgi:hypothetical protein
LASCITLRARSVKRSYIAGRISEVSRTGPRSLSRKSGHSEIGDLGCQFGSPKNVPFKRSVPDVLFLIRVGSRPFAGRLCLAALRGRRCPFLDDRRKCRCCVHCSGGGKTNQGGEKGGGRGWKGGKKAEMGGWTQAHGWHSVGRPMIEYPHAAPALCFVHILAAALLPPGNRLRSGRQKPCRRRPLC